MTSKAHTWRGQLDAWQAGNPSIAACCRAHTLDHAQFMQRGHRVHRPRVLWLHHAMRLRRNSVRAWIVYWNEQIETSGPHDPMVLTVRTMIRDATDAYLALNSLCAQTDEQTHKEWL